MITRSRLKPKHDYEWDRVRQRALLRDNFECQGCHDPRKRPDVHHIKGRGSHPELRYELSNLVSLCRACHNKEHPGPRWRVRS